jgi:hypothetical protein
MLLKELDYMPLAITQAAAFIRRNKVTSLKFYLGKLCQFHMDVKDVLSYELRDPRRHAGTPSAIFRTWQISYEQIETENRLAVELLSLMAVLDNQSVPQMLLTVDAGRDEVDVAEIEAIQMLLDFALVKGDEEYQFFSMHPLQQLVSITYPENSFWKRSTCSVTFRNGFSHKLILYSALTDKYLRPVDPELAEVGEA